MAHEHLYRSPWEESRWAVVDIKPSLLMEALRVFSWFGMILFAIGTLLNFTVDGSPFALVALFAGLFWMACSIALIRIQRIAHKKFRVIQ